MFEKQEFIKSIYNVRDIPKDTKPSVILCGRSNVGKSSLINSLFNRRNLAKISSTPGKTRSINYYEIDEVFYLVDLPGYGYAKTSKKEREFWGYLLSEFITQNENIKLAFHIIDSRHKPTELDVHMNSLLKESGIPYIVILSKVDKLNQSELSKVLKNAIEYFPELSFGDNLMVYSAIKKTGRREVMSRLSSLFIK